MMGQVGVKAFQFCDPFAYDVPRALLLFARLRGLFARPRFEISDL